MMMMSTSSNAANFTTSHAGLYQRTCNTYKVIFRILKNHCKEINGTHKDLTSSEIQFFPLTKVETLITFGQCEYKHFNTTKMYLHVG